MWQITIQVENAKEAWALIQELSDLGKTITVRRVKKTAPLEEAGLRRK